MDEWWGDLGGTLGSQQRALLLPRLFFQHFTRTCLIVERDDARLAAFLVGFVSQSQLQVAYIHFVGVDPELRRTGLGATMYASFFEDVAERGVRSVRCITSPGNSVSVAFHQCLGFEIDPSDTVMSGVPVQIDYDGPGLHRVAFTRAL
jgi:ribosomal protein S18 acetylase RimI-like enzyme